MVSACMGVGVLKPMLFNPSKRVLSKLKSLNIKVCLLIYANVRAKVRNSSRLFANPVINNEIAHENILCISLFHYQRFNMGVLSQLFHYLWVRQTTQDFISIICKKILLKDLIRWNWPPV